jgi:hypothetical protein
VPSRFAASLFVLALGVSAGCRYEGIWTGAEFTRDGEVIRAAAAEPLCGCLGLTNVSTQPVHIRSEMEGVTLGRTELAPGASMVTQFDWGGPRETQVFSIDTWTRQGARLRAQDVLRIDDTGWPWHACGMPEPRRARISTCADGPLKLESGRARLW